MSDHAGVFEEHRDHLEQVAYRMVGSVAQARDLVQDAYLRWRDIDLDEVNDAKSYLTTIITRLSIDHMRSARARREEYTGPWLPEPVAGDAFVRPDRPAELTDSLSTAFLIMLESLNPVERAVFLLREVFDYAYEEIAEFVDKTEVNCRKIASRARQRVSDEPDRFEPTPEQQETLVREFMEAIDGEDMAGLLDVLADDIVLYSDGGGNAAHALDPIDGPLRVARFLIGINRNAPESLEVEPRMINGSPGFIAYIDGQVHSVVALRLGLGAVENVYIVVNPEKLKHLSDEAAR